MRLTIINRYFAPDISPTAQLCGSLAEHRVARGDLVTVVCGRDGYVETSAVDDGGSGQVRLRRAWSSRFGKTTKVGRIVDWFSFYALACLRCLLLPRQDVIIALTTPPYIAFAAVLHKLIHAQTKIVLWNMDCYPEVAEEAGLLDRAGRVSRLLHCANRLLFRALDHLICLDGAMARLLLSQYVSAEHQLPTTIIPNWEPVEFFRDDHTANRWNDEADKTSRNGLVVLYLGNAGFAHEFETLMGVAERLRDKPVIFLFVGGGAERPWIEQESKRRSLTTFRFREYVPTKEETRSIMASADCALITLKPWAAGVVSPSKLHGNLAMALPILYVGPEGSNVDECIQRFDCGISCRPGDVDRLHAFILLLADDRLLRKEFGRRARAAFEGWYSDRRTLPQFDDVLDGLMDKKPSEASANCNQVDVRPVPASKTSA